MNIQVKPRPQDAIDAAFMEQALNFARGNLGLVAPNPSVGALVVRNGIVVGRGVTSRGGRPHAETLALDQAGAAAGGATLYVTLEPCSHVGHTGPCADAVISAGVARVVSALDDPDARVSGRGHARMRAAGIEVIVGIGAQAAMRDNLGHLLRVTQNRPMVTLKLAETRDGYAAGDEHDPRLMITGAAANDATHALRAHHDAIMVGIGTVLADDPLMSVRLKGCEDRRPLRVVLDTHARLPLGSRLAATVAELPVLVIAGQGADGDRIAALRRHGIEVAQVQAAADGHVDAGAALRHLAGRGLTRIFSEGGPRVASALILQGFADACVLFTRPAPLGRPGVPALSAAARARLDHSPQYRLATDDFCGQDRMRCYDRVLD